MENSKSITLFGIKYSGKELIDLCDCKISDSEIKEWEKDIFSFILNWISNSDHMLVMTSGSTGTPKTISILKEHMVESAKATITHFQLSSNSTVWLCLPVGYIAGKMMIVRAMVGNINLVYSEPSSIPDIDVSVIDFVAMVQNQVANLLKSSNGISLLEKAGHLLVGGSQISHNVEVVLSNNHNISAWHSYGMTETITHIALRSIGDNDSKAIFTPMNGVKLSLNSQCQLIINYKAIGVSNLNTNDIAQLYDDGTFSILGRVDDVIISGGIKIMPEPIENTLNQYLDYELFVSSLPDEVLGQKLTLFIEGKDIKLSFEKLYDLLANNFNKYEIPKTVCYIKKFVRTGNGKINRKETVGSYLNAL